MKKNLFFAALALVALASCTDDQFVGDITSPQDNSPSASDAIVFNSSTGAITRAGEFVGATAAEKLGGMFVVEGTKGKEETNSPSTTVVFDNYLVGYTPNTAATTESNSHNWEYVGLENGISGRMTGLPTANSTWAALHPTGTAQSQTVKFWDYSVEQYDFIAWSTGNREAVTTDAADGKVKVTRINTGETLKTNGFQMTAYDADDLLQCYYTDIITVPKANYGTPVTLTFRNMAAKVRVALYETVPGYSVKNVYFYTSDDNPTTPEDLGSATTSTATAATLFTMGTGVSLPQSGAVTVMYPHIGTTHRGDPSASPAVPQTEDYNKASVTVTPGTGPGSTSTKQAFGALTAQYVPAEAYEGANAVSVGDAVPADYATIVGSAAAGSTLTAAEAAAYNAKISFYLGRTLPTATFAGDATKDFYTAVIPNTNGVPLTLRVDYTLVATDGSGETINVYGAKAVVPATYTVWQPNYAYTYVFKISDNSNGWTSKTTTGSPEGPAGLFPITFDAVVTSFIDTNAEQTTVTTVATPSITTYQQGHVHTLNPSTTNNEYSKSQTAGVSSDIKDVYVQVMSTGASPALMTDLKTSGKSLLFKITKASTDEDYDASEAEVIDALQNRTNEYNATDPIGRNGIKLTNNTNIANDVESIVNGVDDQPITVTSGTAAKIAIARLATGTYAYVYSTTVPENDEKVYHVAAATSENYTNYYAVALTGSETPLASGTAAAAGKVYFVKNVDAKGSFVSYTFKQTKVGDDVTDLVVADIPTAKASGGFVSTNFYFDVYNQNDGEYAVKVIKVVD